MFSFFSSTPSISTTELEGLLPNVKVLDVRTPTEYRMGHIHQANNHPLDQISSYQGNKDEAIYVIYQSGMRSKQAAHALTKMGYNVTNVSGGMNAWSGRVVGGK